MKNRVEEREGLPKEACPVEWVQLSEGQVLAERWLGCPLEWSCLGWAADHAWQGFSCRECEFGKDRGRRRERRQDHDKDKDKDKGRNRKSL